MNKKLIYSLIILITIISFSTNVYSKSLNTYKNISSEMFVSDIKESISIFNITDGDNKVDALIPVGNTVGIKINTDGILVLGTGYINTEDGRVVIPADDKVFVGDIIYKVNGERVQNKEQLSEITSATENVKLVLNRNNEIMEIEVKAEKSLLDNKYKLGLWVRDTTQGIGTISFINSDTNEYYALGHGILDVDTKDLMTVKDGDVLVCDITAINPGEEGKPGEIVGEIKIGESIGTVRSNTSTGVTGNINNYDKLNITTEKMKICPKEEVEIGEAYILSNIQNNDVEKYSINILDINDGIGNKNMIIEITDKKLIEETGGIIQGMSGSPIIQNDRIVGALTHVFVNEPKKGYGVFVENMLLNDLDNK